MHSSRVGTTTRAWAALDLGVLLVEPSSAGAMRRCSSGTPKPRVLPVPVFAWPMMSLPARASGSVSSWMANAVDDAVGRERLDDRRVDAELGEGLGLGGGVGLDVRGGVRLDAAHGHAVGGLRDRAAAGHRSHGRDARPASARSRGSAACARRLTGPCRTLLEDEEAVGGLVTDGVMATAVTGKDASVYRRGARNPTSPDRSTPRGALRPRTLRP